MSHTFRLGMIDSYFHFNTVVDGFALRFSGGAVSEYGPRSAKDEERGDSTGYTTVLEW